MAPEKHVLLLIQLLFWILPVSVTEKSHSCYGYSKKCSQGCLQDCSGYENSQCYVLYKKVDKDHASILLGGCMQQTFHHTAERNSVCRDVEEDKFVCYCAGEKCNADIERVTKYSENLTRLTADHWPFQQDHHENFEEEEHTSHILPIAALSLLGVLMLCKMLTSLKHNRRVQNNDIEMDSMEEGCSTRSETLTTPTAPVELVQLIYDGNFSQVWKAKMDDHMVAVKLASNQKRAGLKTEIHLFNFHRIKHENIIHFYRVIQQEVDGIKKNMILLKYHERGDLKHFLESNTIEYFSVLAMINSIVAGLQYLHAEDDNMVPVKYRIAHRDIKSSNILMNCDNSCCIADFGFSVILPENIDFQDAFTDIEQVGTLRYMSPEVLKGVLDFTMEAFLRVDIYALALVMWEIVSRCEYGSDVPLYKAPYEEKIGRYPTKEAVITCVLINGYRPPFRSVLSQNENLASICKTIEECWAEEPGERLTASCVYARLAMLMEQE